MIPIKLTIEGIYSYQERQTIDFTELTSNGLFGILGSVGSGKSSILEAITYALYGETVRLNRNDKRSYNMMNLKSDRLYLEFDFLNHDNIEFRVVREIKRNSKRFDVVSTPSVQFYEQKDGGNWIPIDNSTAEDIIGLSYDNFRRTIIIPQGQFKEFLELGAKDRTNMLKDIFHLHKYDLQNKTSILSAQNKSQYDKMEGRLMEYESINEEDINNRKVELANLTKQVEAIKKEHELLNEKYQRQKSLKDDFVSLQKYKSLFEDKHKLLPSITDKQKQVETYERILAKFDKLLSDLKREDKLLSDLKIEHTKESRELARNAESLKETKGQLSKILPYYEQLSAKRNEEIDLDLIIQILESQSKVVELQGRDSKGKGIVKVLDEALSETVDEIKSAEASIGNLLKQKFDSSLLISIDGWYLQHTNNLKSIEQHQKVLVAKQDEQKRLQEEVKDKKVDINNFESIYIDAINKINEREKVANNQKTNLELQNKMADYANALHDGKACPLCGSENHPHIAGVEDVSSHINAINDELSNIKKEAEQWQTYRSQAQRLSDKSKELSLQVVEASQKLDAEKIKLNTHKSLFVWQEFNPDDRSEFDAKKNQSLQVEKQIEELNLKTKRMREDEAMQRKNLDTYKKELDKIKNQIIELSTKVSTNIGNLKVLSFDSYKNSTKDDITQTLLELKKKNDEVEKQYSKLSESATNIEKILATKESVVNGLFKRITDAANMVHSINTDINAQLVSEGYDNIKSVEDIISQKIDVAKEREKINNFLIEYQTLKNQIKDLNDKLSKAEYDDAQFAKQEDAWIKSTQFLEENNSKLVTLKSDLERIEKLLKEKEQLTKELDKLGKRAENLRVMSNLFKAYGFVQYISTMYLEQLCDHANERFRRMTRNQLRLQINESNDFEIIDYLNEGKTRSVKTLSGGQAFQVSLSLALALAESVQSNAKAEKNFFFIDEGFGTQDLDSVNIVFETLLSLNKENKIVGIISHVEELKERMPMTLTVVKDTERGSLIN